MEMFVDGNQELEEIEKAPLKNEGKDSLVDDIRKKFGNTSICRMGSNEKMMNIPLRGSGSILLDWALGGGYAHGRAVELRGYERSGKTTALSLAIAEAQKAEPDKENAIIDLENTYNPEWAQKLGVDTDKLLISQPDTYAEKVFEFLEYLLKSGKFAIIGIDSIAGLVPKDEFEAEDFEKSGRVGGSSKLITMAIRRLINTGLLMKSGTTLIMINQLRDKIGGFSMYGTPTDTPGGRALKHCFTHQVDVSIGEYFSKGTGASKVNLGQQAAFKVAKNKIAPPLRRATVDLYYDFGVDKVTELVSVAKQVGVLQGTSWLKFFDPFTGEIIMDSEGNEMKWNGIAKAVEAVNADIKAGGDIYIRMYDLVKRQIIEG